MNIERQKGELLNSERKDGEGLCDLELRTRLTE
jgi:hypothetical protein